MLILTRLSPNGVGGSFHVANQFEESTEKILPLGSTSPLTLKQIVMPVEILL